MPAGPNRLWLSEYHKEAEVNNSATTCLLAPEQQQPIVLSLLKHNCKPQNYKAVPLQQQWRTYISYVNSYNVKVFLYSEHVLTL